jgi:phosphate transport system substrate-binding protein
LAPGVLQGIWVGLLLRIAAKPLFLSVLACITILLAGCGEPMATPESVYLQAAGSMAMGPIADELARGFREQDPWIHVQILGLEPTGGLGTSYGLEALRNGDTDLALASWLAPVADRSASKGLALDPAWHTTAIARDGLAIIVHPDNPVDGLGLLQLRDLFSGRSDEWHALNGGSEQGLVVPVSREAGSGTRAAFEALVMEDLSVSPRALMAPSGMAVVDYVAQNAQAIGYVSMGDVKPGVKVLKVEGELPTVDAAGRGIYALTRELWLVTVGPPSPPVQDFIDFSLSPAGQQIVEGHVGSIR